MFDAIVSIAFNTGTGHAVIKRIIAAINAKDYKKASDELRNGPQSSKGTKMPGLTRRRNAEADLFMKEIPTA